MKAPLPPTLSLRSLNPERINPLLTPVGVSIVSIADRELRSYPVGVVRGLYETRGIKALLIPLGGISRADNKKGFRGI